MAPVTEWVFGFGSLVWKPGFQYSKRVEGCIKDYRRVFYQGSTDHRGTPQHPGRTVTIEYCPGAVTWGAAYKLAGSADQQAETLRYLEWREKQYDVRAVVDVFSSASSDVPVVANALVYIASPNTEANVNYLGPASLHDIALQIATAHGPSGRNAEYVYMLADAMRSMGVHDAELFELETLVKRFESCSTDATVQTDAQETPQLQLTSDALCCAAAAQ